ncbi:MAG: EAL domain-containing protein [Treponemataceae bacterium]|nr:EAL domain-containing protein [Treponemataceae bacterium]
MASSNKELEKDLTDIEFENSLFKEAILFNAILFFKVNISKDIITEDNILNPNSEIKVPQPEDFGLKPPYSFKELCQKIRSSFIPEDTDDDVTFLDDPLNRIKSAYDRGVKNFCVNYWIGKDNKKTTFINQLVIIQKHDDGDLYAFIVLRNFYKVQQDLKRSYEKQIENYAFYDPITEGPNYNKFKTTLQGLGIPGVIVAIDIHSFKIVNSICGISKGDNVIKTVWDKILSTLDSEKYEFAAHVNSDHYIVFYPTYDTEFIIERIGELTQLIRDCSQILKVPTLEPYFGISEWHPGKKVELSNNEAVVAKHTAKNLTSENYSFFDRRDNLRLIREKKIVDAFDSAIENEEFKVWFQPKYNPITKKMVGAEALVRWQQEDGSIISPISFIPIFEQNGIIRKLDEYIFKKVCQYQKNWEMQGKKTVPISVNLSRASLYFKDIVSQYKQILDEIGLDPALVPIEITETAAVNNESIKDIADSFYKAGFPLHMDDFGSGYSSLSTLNVLHFETLKLDKSLVDYIGNFGGDRVIEHTICLAKELGISVTAEGVENEDQDRFLKHIGCDNIQGYFYSKPIPFEEFELKLDNFCILNNNLSTDKIAEHIVEYRQSMIKPTLYTFIVNLTQNYVTQDSGVCDWLSESKNFSSYDEMIKNLAENYVLENDRAAYLNFFDRKKLLDTYCGCEETRILHYHRFLKKTPSNMRSLINIFSIPESNDLWMYVSVTQL